MKRIMIVDDSAYQRKILGDLVAKLGYESESSSSGEELLDRLNDDHDCVFLDLLMSGISGIDVLKKLKERESAPPVIVISADVQQVRKDECMELGAVAFIDKIISEDEVKETLDQLFIN